jgi:uncharacterized membrane protein
LRIDLERLIINAERPPSRDDFSPRNAMRQDDLRAYYEGLSDAAIRECFVAGPDDFEPATWHIVREQMELRALPVAEPAPTTPPLVERRGAFVIDPRAAAEKRVADGGSVALVLAVAVLALGVKMSASMRHPARVIAAVCVLALAYATTGTLMRKRRSIAAAVTAEFLTVALYSPNLMYLVRHRMWAFLALVLAIYGPPIYWFWRAYRAALALHGYDVNPPAVPKGDVAG